MEYLSRTLRWMAGSFIFCERAAFTTVGGFNLELFASEEIDISRKLKKLAKEQGREVVILHRHPLVTSIRKLRLYSLGEMLGLTCMAALRPRKTLTSRARCTYWYDGRR